MRSWLAAAVFVALSLSLGGYTRAQDMLDQVDLGSPAFTMAEMTRGEIEAAIAKLAPEDTLDLSNKSLNGLDLSGIDLRRTNLQ